MTVRPANRDGRIVLRTIMALSALAALGGLLYAWLGDEAAGLAAAAVDEQTHPGLFVLLFAVLPLVGFPITPFLVFLGVRFGAWPAMLLVAAVMPLHLAVAYWVVHSFLRTPVLRLLGRMHYRLPRIPEHRTASFSFFFMLVPGLSYALKNHILPLAGVPFRCFFWSGFLVQGALSVPFVLLGDALTKRNRVLLVAAAALVVGLYLLVNRVRGWWCRRYGR